MVPCVWIAVNFEGRKNERQILPMEWAKVCVLRRREQLLAHAKAGMMFVSMSVAGVEFGVLLELGLDLRSPSAQACLCSSSSHSPFMWVKHCALGSQENLWLQHSASTTQRFTDFMTRWEWLQEVFPRYKAILWTVAVILQGLWNMFAFWET